MDGAPGHHQRSRFHLLLTDSGGQALRATSVELEVSSPARKLAWIPVPVVQRNGVWGARFRFPFAGDWNAVLTMHHQSPTAIVAGGELTIGQ